MAPDNNDTGANQVSGTTTANVTGGTGTGDGSAVGGNWDQGSSGDTAAQIQPDQHVHDADGNHVGTVDHLDGERIKLKKNDSSDGHHHYVSLSDVESADGGKVTLRAGASATQS